MLAKSPDDRPQKVCDVASEITQFASEANLAELAETCRSSLDMPSADVDVTDDASFLVSRSVEPEKQITQRWPRTAIGFFFAFIAASVFFFVTNNGIVQVKVQDEAFHATIDGQIVTVEEDGNSEPISLRAGDHKLVVKVGETELLTNDFEMKRDGRVAISVELLAGEVIVSRDGEQVGSKLMPGTSHLATVGSKTEDSRGSAKPSTKRPGELWPTCHRLTSLSFISKSQASSSGAVLCPAVPIPPSQTM